MEPPVVQPPRKHSIGATIAYLTALVVMWFVIVSMALGALWIVVAAVSSAWHTAARSSARELVKPECLR